MAVRTDFTAGEVLAAQDLDDTFAAKADASSVAVLQVVSTTKTDTFTTSSTSLVDVTGLSVSITPTSASNKVLVTVSLNYGADVGTTSMQACLFRDSTQIALGDAASNRSRTTWLRENPQSAGVGDNLSVTFLDSPATTSATTYKVQIRSDQTSSVYVNRTHSDADNASSGTRSISTITVMEVTP